MKKEAERSMNEYVSLLLCVTVILSFLKIWFTT